MPVHEYEMYHGIALTKILRSKKPISLCMIETKPSEDWSVYKLNDQAKLFLKHSLSHRSTSRGGEGISWNFVFSPAQIVEINKLKTDNFFYIALICGSLQIKKNEMQICLLFPEDITTIGIFIEDHKNHSLTVKYCKGQKLAVFEAKKEKLKIPLNRMEQWEIPGA